MANPFHYNRPVRPENFVGRWPLVHKIADDLARVDGESYAIVGGRRFGKSSTLLALQHTLAERLATTPPGETHVLPLMLDFKALELDSHHRLFAQVIEELRRALRPTSSPRRRGPHLPLELDGALLEGLYPPGQPPAPLSAFRHAVGDVIDHAFDVHGPLRLALLIDEIEEALQRPWSETLFNNLRSLIYSGALAESLRLVIAGDDRVLKVRAQGSPLLNMLDPEYLTVLDEADTRQIIARADGVPPAIADAVVCQSGGHPYLTQYLMHQLWGDDLAQAAPDSVQASVHQLSVRRRSILETWYNAIGPAGRAVCVVLAGADDDAWLTTEAIEARMADRSLSATEGLVNLCYHGFATHDGDWRRYHRTGDLFCDWFLEEHVKGSAAGGHVYRTRLRRLLATRFSAAELRALCFDLGIDYENLRGEGKAEKAGALVDYLEDRERIPALIELGRRERPDIPW